MINSVVLALVDSIVGKNVSSLIKYIVEKHVIPRKLDSIGYVQTFNKLMTSYRNLLVQTQNAQTVQPSLTQRGASSANAAGTSGSIVGSEAISIVDGGGGGGEVAAVVSNTGTPDAALAIPMVTDHTKAESQVAGDQLHKPRNQVEDLASSLMVDLVRNEEPLPDLLSGLQNDVLPDANLTNTWSKDPKDGSICADTTNAESHSAQGEVSSGPPGESSPGIATTGAGLKRPAGNNGRHNDGAMKKPKTN